MVDCGWASVLFDPHQLGQGDQLAVAGFHLQSEYVIGAAARGAVKLHDYLAHLVAFKAVIDVVTAEAGSEGVDHGAEIHPERGHLQPIWHQLHQGGTGGEAG